MFEIWIPITIFAAFSQNLRSIYQKKLQKNISNISSTYTRFLFGLPFVFIYFLFLYNYSNTTFLVSNSGIIYKIWNKVKVKDHISEVISASKDMLKL